MYFTIEKKYTTIIILSVIFLVSFLVRFVNLDNLGPSRDELLHLVAAKNLNLNNNPTAYQLGQYFSNAQVSYERGFVLTYTISKLFRFFDDSLVVARLPGIIFSSLTIIPLYFLGRIFNKFVGITTAILWALSPLSILIARNVREYAFFPFFYVLIILYLYFLYTYIEKLAHKKKQAPKIYWVILNIIIFITPVFYAIIVDPYSTFKQILITYFAFFIILGFSIIRTLHLRKIVYTYLACIPICTFILYTLLFSSQNLSTLINNNISTVPNFDRYFINKLLSRSPHANFIVPFENDVAIFLLYILIFTSIYGLIYLLKNNTKIRDFIFYYLTNFLLYLYIFTFHFSRSYSKPRYGFILLIMSLVFISVGVWFIYKKISEYNIKHTIIPIVVLVSLVIYIVKPLNTFKYDPYFIEKNGFIELTEENHYNSYPLLHFAQIENIFNENTAIITSVPNLLLWNFDTLIQKPENIFPINPVKYNGDMWSTIHYAIEDFDQGYIIIENARAERSSLSLANRDFILNGVRITYIDLSGAYTVFKWDKNTDVI